MKKTHSVIMLVISTIALANFPVDTGYGQAPTVFSYQGELIENGLPANGTFDMSFSLWNAEIAGNQYGVDVDYTVPVTNGRFSVDVDFGSVLFTFQTTTLFLEVEVNNSTLSPRTRLTSAPFSAMTRGIIVGSNNEVGIGISPSDELHVAGDNATLRLQDTTTPGGFTLIEDPQPTQLRISKINNNGGQVLMDMNPQPTDGTSNALVRFFRQTDTTGIKRVQFLRGNFTTSPSASIGVDGEDSYFQMHGGNLGIGTDAPEYPLHVVQSANDFTAIFARNTAQSGVNSAVLGYADSPDGLAVYGSALATSGLNTGVFGRTNSNDGRGLFGLAAGIAGTNYGVYAASDSTTGFDVYAAGAGINYGSESSRRWKSNINVIQDPLDKLAKLRGVYFDWDKDHGGHHDIGMIAEEVGDVLPEIVNYEENGVDAMGMDYSKLTPLLVEAVKALRRTRDSDVKELTASLTEKNAQIEALQIEITELRTIVERITVTASKKRP